MLDAAMVLASGWFAVAPARADVLAVGEKGKEVSYEVQKGDTLWDLSDDFYDDPFQYPRIWKANPFIKDPHWIYPGQMLTIPGVMEAEAPAPIEPVVAPPPPPPPAPAPQAPVVSEVEPPPAPVVAVKPPLPAISENLPKEERDPMLNEDFPPSQAGSEDTMPKRPVAPDWKPLGAIVEEDFMNATDGDTVHVKWREDVNLLPGELVYVVQNAGDVPGPDKKRIGIYLQTLAQVRVTKALSRRSTEGVIEKARDGVKPGDAVQLGAP